MVSEAWDRRMAGGPHPDKPSGPSGPYRKERACPCGTVTGCAPGGSLSEPCLLSGTRMASLPPCKAMGLESGKPPRGALWTGLRGPWSPGAREGCLHPRGHLPALLRWHSPATPRKLLQDSQSPASHNTPACTHGPPRRLAHLVGVLAIAPAPNSPMCSPAPRWPLDHSAHSVLVTHQVGV